MTTDAEEPGRPAGTPGAWWFWEVEPEVWSGDEASEQPEMVAGAERTERESPETLREAASLRVLGPARRPGRLAFGLVVLAAERLRAGSPSSSVLTGVGLLQQGATEARAVARRAIEPPARLASRGATLAGRLPGAKASRRSLTRSRQRFERILLDARRRGEVTIAAGRADASALVRATVADGLAWAQAQAMPQLVDGLVPHLVDEVVPRLIDGALPEIRTRVIPVVIEDLTHDPQIRELVREQAHGVVGEAATHLRATTATADDRVESAFRRLVRSPEPDPPGAPGNEDASGADASRG